MRPAAIGLGTTNAFFYAWRFRRGNFDLFGFETVADDAQPLLAKSPHVILFLIIRGPHETTTRLAKNAVWTAIGLA